jgi:hypothetical protein
LNISSLGGAALKVSALAVTVSAVVETLEEGWDSFCSLAMPETGWRL